MARSLLSMNKNRTGPKPLSKASSVYSKSFTMTKNGNFRSSILKKQKKAPKQVALQDSEDDFKHDYDYEDLCDNFRSRIDNQTKRKVLNEKIAEEKKLKKHIVLANGRKLTSDPK